MSDSVEERRDERPEWEWEWEWLKLLVVTWVREEKKREVFLAAGGY